MTTGTKKSPLKRLTPGGPGVTYFGDWTHEMRGDVLFHRQLGSNVGMVRRPSAEPDRYWSGDLTIRQHKATHRTPIRYSAECALTHTSGVVARLDLDLGTDRDAAKAACETWAATLTEAYAEAIEQRFALRTLECEITARLREQVKNA